MDATLSDQLELAILVLMVLAAASPLVVPWPKLALAFACTVAPEVAAFWLLWNSAQVPRDTDNNDWAPLGLFVTAVVVASVLVGSLLVRVALRGVMAWLSRTQRASSDA